MGTVFSLLRSIARGAMRQYDPFTIYGQYNIKNIFMKIKNQLL